MHELRSKYFDWAFENPDLNTPTHTAVFMWIVEKYYRSGCKHKVSLPTSESMEACGIKSYNTYSKVLADLVSWDFVQMLVKAQNQHRCNIVALSNFNKATDEAPNKALDKALSKHTTEQVQKQVESTQQSTDSILRNNDITNNGITNNDYTIVSEEETHTNFEQVLSLEKTDKKNAPLVAPPPPRVLNSPYGDGELHAYCRAYAAENPGRYEKELYEAFLAYWTAKLQAGQKKGKELWRTKETFELSGRLATWNRNEYSNQHKSNKNGNGKNSTAVVTLGRPIHRPLRSTSIVAKAVGD